MIEKEYEDALSKFKLKTNKDLLDCAKQKWLNYWFFIEGDADLFTLFLENRNEFNWLLMSLEHSFKPIQMNWLSDRRVEMALRVSLANTLLYKDRMKTTETYVSNLTYSKEQLAKALATFNPYITQNPLAFLIDQKDIAQYASIIRGDNIDQVWLSKKNWKNFKTTKYFISRQKIDPYYIDDVIKYAYHPTVWYLICTNTLLWYSHLFIKVKEYVDKLKVIPENG